MSKEQPEATSATPDYLKKAEKAFKIGSLALGVVLTALQIVSVVRDDAPETVKM